MLLGAGGHVSMARDDISIAVDINRHPDQLQIGIRAALAHEMRRIYCENRDLRRALADERIARQIEVAQRRQMFVAQRRKVRP